MLRHRLWIKALTAKALVESIGSASAAISTDVTAPLMRPASGAAVNHAEPTVQRGTYTACPGVLVSWCLGVLVCPVACPGVLCPRVFVCPGVLCPRVLVSWGVSWRAHRAVSWCPDPPLVAARCRPPAAPTAAGFNIDKAASHQPHRNYNSFCVAYFFVAYLHYIVNFYRTTMVSISMCRLALEFEWRGPGRGL